MIPNGYYIKARCIQESAIANAPPHIREIWDWLLKEANHADGKSHGRIIRRGQCVRRYEDILKGLSWYVGFRKESYTKWQCETAMKWLTKHEMVTTEKTTRGLIITICNYDHYQNPANYESHKERHSKTTTEPQPPDTINKKEKKVRKEGKNNISGSSKFIPPTQEQVKQYAQEIGYPLDPEKFINSYEQKGWMIGRTQMKDWKAAVRNWKSNNWGRRGCGSSNKDKGGIYKGLYAEA